MGSLPINPVIHSIAVDPQKPQRVYAAGPAGLFRSDNGGLDWIQADKGLTSKPLAVAVDPILPQNKFSTTPQTIFTVLVDASVWKSADGGTTWQVLKVSQ